MSCRLCKKIYVNRPDCREARFNLFNQKRKNDEVPINLKFSAVDINIEKEDTSKSNTICRGLETVEKAKEIMVSWGFDEDTTTKNELNVSLSTIYKN